MTRILAFSGKSGAGKTTLANFLRHNEPELFGSRLRDGGPYRLRLELYAFADRAKELLQELFGLTHGQLWGAEKDTPTRVRWEDFGHPGCPARSNMTARELLQEWATMMRRLCPGVWTDILLKKIRQQAPRVAIVHDLRFPDELEYLLYEGAQVIRLPRAKDPSNRHDSETALDAYPWGFIPGTHLLDNQHSDLFSTQASLVNLLTEWGWTK